MKREKNCEKNLFNPGSSESKSRLQHGNPSDKEQISPDMQPLSIHSDLQHDEESCPINTKSVQVQIRKKYSSLLTASFTWTTQV